MKKLISTALASFALAAPAHAWYEVDSYKYSVDRFTGTKGALTRSSPSDCKLTKSLKGKLYECILAHQSGNGYTGLDIAFMKESRGWDLLDYKHSVKQVPAIVTFTDGTVKRYSFPASLDTDTLYGGTVSETVKVQLTSLQAQLSRVAKVEIQYGSSEFSWVPSKQAQCVARLAKTCL